MFNDLNLQLNYSIAILILISIEIRYCIYSFLCFDSLLNILEEIVSNRLILSVVSNRHHLSIGCLLAHDLLGDTMLCLFQGFNEKINSGIELAQVHLHVFLLTLNAFWLFVRMEIFQCLLICGTVISMSLSVFFSLLDESCRF